MWPDHVHLLLSINATTCIADLVREIKKASNRWATERFSRFEWQGGYAAFSVSPDAAPAVARYIGDQEMHHRLISSAEELRSLLIELGVGFDERYFA